jgi:oligosaccharide repeat unit polymerase
MRRMPRVLLVCSVATTVLAGWGVSAVGAPTGIWIPISLGGVVALAPSVALLRRQFDPFEPVYLFSFAYAVLFVARPAYDASTQGLLISGYDPSATYSRALWVGLVGACAFYVGYYSRAAERVGGRMHAPTRRISQHTLDGLIVAGVALSLALFGLLLLHAGGRAAFAILSGHRTAERTQILADSSGYLYSAPLALLSFGVVLIVFAPRWSSARALAGFGLIALSQVINLGSGDRSWMLPALAAPFVVRYLKAGTRPAPVTIVTALLAVFALGVVLPGQYREGTSGSPARSVTTVLTNPRADLEAFFGGGDTAMAPNLAIELQFVPSHIGYRYGTTYAEALSRPVPRALWPKKPKAADTMLMQTIWPSLAASRVGFSFSLFGEPFLNGGFAGVIVVAVAFGVFWRALYVWFCRSASHPLAILIFALSWPFLIVYMRGGLGVDYQRHVIAVLPAVVGFALARRRTEAINVRQPALERT